ncbi:hypothetical protein DJ564_28550 [Pseudomonas sp. 31-12]|nr:hypothetical protein DJ564_28550 [Pseudomonas sp. 31-12]
MEPRTNGNLWRGSLLPLGRAAAPRRTAAQPSGSKLPRHGFSVTPVTLNQTKESSSPPKNDELSSL